MLLSEMDRSHSPTALVCALEEAALSIIAAVAGAAAVEQLDTLRWLADTRPIHQRTKQAV